VKKDTSVFGVKAVVMGRVDPTLPTGVGVMLQLCRSAADARSRGHIASCYTLLTCALSFFVATGILVMLVHMMGAYSNRRRPKCFTDISSPYLHTSPDWWVLLSSFLAEKFKAQRGEVAFPRSHS